MFRSLQFLALVLCSLCAGQAAQAGNTYFWLSTQGFPSASPLPTTATSVPEFDNFQEQAGGSIYIWGRPEVGEVLENWSLNLKVSNPDIILSTSTEVFKPNVTGVPRWQSWGEPIGDPIQTKNIAGFSPTHVGQGIGIATPGTDLYFDSVRTAWLLAKVNYTLKPFSTFKSADLFLQIGSLGMSNVGESSFGVDVVFGDLSDNTLILNAANSDNGGQRETSSASPDGVIKYFAKPDADFDGDTDVDGRDFLIWQRNFGTLVGATNAMGNANPGPIEVPGKDGQVNKIDLAAWQFQYGSTGLPLLVSSLQVVPEPSAMLLAIWAASAMLTTRRQRYASKVSNLAFPLAPPSRQIRPLASLVTGGE